MRENPYTKGLKDYLPLFMQGPRTVLFLTTNETQKVVVEESMMTTLHSYDVKDVFFTMVQPPVINHNGSVTPEDICNIEMGRTEVTQGLFKTVMGWDYSRFEDKPQNPVEMVTLFDCFSFCNTLSELLGLNCFYEMTRVAKQYDEDYKNSIFHAYVTTNEDSNGFRLPTEYEWESFAKAGTQNKWSGTNDVSELSKYAWYTGNSRYRTYPVGDKLPNEWGLYDMSGSVWEWCWDKYDPKNEHPLTKRAVRGGSLWHDADHCQIDYRDWLEPDYQSESLGFRICRTIK